MAETYKILSVGGSIVIPPSGFDHAFLKRFKKMVIDQIGKGEKLILVIGGGGTVRQYQDAGRRFGNLNNEDLDWIGIQGTIFNAHLVRFMFKEYAHEQVVTDPTKKVKTDKPLIIAAGYKPGCSTDMDAVLLAKAYGAKEILNLSNIEYAYTKDPNKYKDAVKIEKMNWKAFRDAVVGDTWDPGKSAPFDPIASKEAEKLKLTVHILKGTHLPTVRKAIEGKKFPGSTIHP